ncbi:LytTR family DNA-binding domain-containing protein [Anaerolentibacter hominis]|uniref:LytR/AlgR family response regulator transcription factor n=1 Tax=Anaerolentibacter hominis TaxID=3079009 RepID=UPI0031B892EE
MLKIAVIEDEPHYSRELTSAILACTCPEQLKINCFVSGEAFLSSQWQETAYTAVFIDIELNGMNGMELARLLRQKGYQAMIVFTTNYEQYVYDGYEVEAFRYLRKPVKMQEIQVCIDRMGQDRSSSSLIFSFKRQKYCIPYQDILYISSYGHYLTIHTREQDYEWKYLLKDLQPRLPGRFVRCHRSFVVNLDYMRKLDGKQILLSNGEKIDAAAGYLEDVRRAVSRLV